MKSNISTQETRTSGTGDPQEWCTDSSTSVAGLPDSPEDSNDFSKVQQIDLLLDELPMPLPPADGSECVATPQESNRSTNLVDAVQDTRVVFENQEDMRSPQVAYRQDAVPAMPFASLTKKRKLQQIDHSGYPLKKPRGGSSSQPTLESQPFTTENARLLTDLYDNIMNIDPTKVVEAWEAWAKSVR
jgi:hypothetical protein